jgi:preprotein translocase subunit SecB
MVQPLAKASFKINDVIFLESNFKRELEIDFSKGEIINEVDLQNNAQLDPDSPNFIVFMVAEIKGKVEEKIVFTGRVHIAGLFEKTGDGELDIETFSKVNGPAIIFPFLREHIAGLGLKAGIGNILLQPINFVKSAE